jgi:hypothetical protein
LCLAAIAVREGWTYISSPEYYRILPKDSVIVVEDDQSDEWKKG